MFQDLSCNPKDREVFDKPIELPKTVPIWIVAVFSTIMFAFSFWSLYHEKANRNRDESLDAKIHQLSTELKKLSSQKDVDQNEIDEAKKKAELFIHQVEAIKKKK